MNQILSIEMSKKKAKNKAPVQIEIKKILIFFAIILLIFGLIIAGKSIFSMISSKKANATIKEDTPNVTTSKQENQLIIAIKHKKEITKIEYNWNNGTSKEIPGDGSNYLETTIDMPSGNNILNITTTDIEGKKYTYNKEFLADPDDPQLTLEEAGRKIKIKAKDNEKLTLITYRWDDDEDHEIEIPEHSSAQIEEEIELPFGNHVLTVVAVNSKNRQVTKTQEIKVLKEPDVDIQIDQTDRGYVILTAVDKVSLMEKMIFWINNDAYALTDTQEDGTKIEYAMPVEPGNNEIKVTGINKEGIEKTKTKIYTYIPEPTEDTEENNDDNENNNENDNENTDNNENNNENDG